MNRPLIAALLAALLSAAGRPAPASDLTALSLEELMGIEVSTVSRGPAPMASTAAAVAVITAEDIRRSGATSIAEALRMVPGMHVARLDANKWAVSSRGFNYRFAEKMLVLVDGRSVYTPLFSGVFWECLDTVLEDIERIEVIRGPGGTLWGANAMNGVVNIITRPAAETRGGLVSPGAGSEERGFGALRYGGAWGERGAWRLYGRTFDRDAGYRGNDAWRMARVGARSDVRGLGRGDLTLQGEYYGGSAHQRVTFPSLDPPYGVTVDDLIRLSGGYVRGAWNRQAPGGHRTEVSGYFDQSWRREAMMSELRSNFDLDLSHHRAPIGRHALSAGLDYRLTDDRIENTPGLRFLPARKRSHLVSAFAQDAVALADGRARLTLGTKAEQSTGTPLEFQPSARLAWMPRPGWAAWGAVTRAIRRPSRADTGVELNLQGLPPETLGEGSPAGMVVLRGSGPGASERMVAYETGVRWEPKEGAWVDLALFRNDYSRLTSIAALPPEYVSHPDGDYVLIPYAVGHGTEGRSYGAEVQAQWTPRPGRRLVAQWTFLDLKTFAAGGETAGEDVGGRTPRHKGSLRASCDVRPWFQVDPTLRFVGRLDALEIPSYWELDLRTGWRLAGGVELDIVGQNLLHPRHPEFSSLYLDSAPSAVERGVYGKLLWRF